MAPPWDGHSVSPPTCGSQLSHPKPCHEPFSLGSRVTPGGAAALPRPRYTFECLSLRPQYALLLFASGVSVLSHV